MTTNFPTIGFIGLGSMGGHMARNLIRAGYSLTVFDLDAAKMAACVGATLADSVATVVQTSEIVMTSVPSFEVAIKVAQDVLNDAKAGQIFIEFSTMTPSQAIELAQAYAAKNAVRLDVPVSGGSGGAEQGTLRMFVGGDEATAKQCWSIFEVLGDAERIVYCGAAGSGQMVKIVNQTAMGLSNAIYLETIGYGVHMGIDVDVMVQGIGGNEPWRQQFDRIAKRIKDSDATHTDVKFVQLRQFAEDAAAHGYTMPLSRALFDFCEHGELVTIEEIYPAPSFWHELMKKNISE